MGGSQGDFCPDDNDIDCIDDTAIGSLEDDDNATEAEGSFIPFFVYIHHLCHGL